MKSRFEFYNGTTGETRTYEVAVEQIDPFAREPLQDGMVALERIDDRSRALAFAGADRLASGYESPTGSRWIAA